MTRQGRHEIVKDGAAVQPYVVYWVKGSKRVFRAPFSTEAAAQAWVDKYGDRPFPERD